jgi:hypothetical protein
LLGQNNSTRSYPLTAPTKDPAGFWGSEAG